MSEKRAIINAEKAINALPDKDVITGFLLVEENGNPKRILQTIKKEAIINLLVRLGGCDVSGEVILGLGFGICFPMDTPLGPRWFFVETRPDFCPFCQGDKCIRNEAELEILGETCWVCNGVGKVLTKPVPQRPARKEEAFGDGEFRTH